jgi:hypothetical protein
LPHQPTGAPRQHVRGPGRFVIIHSPAALPHHRSVFLQLVHRSEHEFVSRLSLVADDKAHCLIALHSYLVRKESHRVGHVYPNNTLYFARIAFSSKGHVIELRSSLGNRVFVLQWLMVMHVGRGLEWAPTEQNYESYGKPAEHAGMNIPERGRIMPRTSRPG